MVFRYVRRLPKAHRVDWGLTTLLAVQALTLFVAVPLSPEHAAGHMLLDVCHLLFAAICVGILTHQRLVQALLLFGLGLVAAVPLMDHRLLSMLGTNGAGQHLLIEAVVFAFNAMVTVLIARHVFGPGKVTAHRVQGAVLVYLNIAALFAIVYSGLLFWWPGAIVSTVGVLPHSSLDRPTAALTYFSLTTLTTTGYGDFVPVHPLARSLANLEAVIGQLFPATLLARIVNLHMEHSRGA